MTLRPQLDSPPKKFTDPLHSEPKTGHEILHHLQSPRSVASQIKCESSLTRASPASGFGTRLLRCPLAAAGSNPALLQCLPTLLGLTPMDGLVVRVTCKYDVLASASEDLGLGGEKGWRGCSPAVRVCLKTEGFWLFTLRPRTNQWGASLQMSQSELEKSRWN